MLFCLSSPVLVPPSVCVTCPIVLPSTCVFHLWLLTCCTSPVFVRFSVPVPSLVHVPSPVHFLWCLQLLLLFILFSFPILFYIPLIFSRPFLSSFSLQHSFALPLVVPVECDIF